MERGDIYQTLSGEFRRNIGAGASVTAVLLGSVFTRLEPVALQMLLGHEEKNTTWRRVLKERLKENTYYQRKLQYA